MSAYDALTKVASAQVITSSATVTQSIPCETHNEATLLVVVSALSGTAPTLSPYFLASPDGINWRIIGTIGAFSGTGSNGVAVQFGIMRFVRAQFDVGGTTPSFTVDAWIHTKRIGA